MKSKKLLTALSLGAITLSVLGTQLMTTVSAAPSSENNNSEYGAADDSARPNDFQGQSQDQQNSSRQERPKLSNVVRTVTNLANGVQVTCTSTDAATVAKLQSMQHPDAPKDGKVTVVHTNIANGIQVTITSDDADTVAKIQEHEGKRGKNGGGPMGQGGQNGQNGHRPDFSSLKDVKVAAQNVANGATITLTSTDAATVTKIQNFAKNFRLPPPGMHGPRQGNQSRQGRQSRQNGQGGQHGQNEQQGPNAQGGPAQE